MIKTYNAAAVSYSTRDFAVLDLAVQILKYLGIEYSKGVGADGMYLCFKVEEAHRFEREVIEWREAATKLVIQH